MHYSKLIAEDVANGPGIRTTLFVSGCTKKCPGCFNEATWKFDAGEEFTIETADTILKMLSKPWIQGFTLLGGEPLHPKNRSGVLQILNLVKERFPDLNIWVYTGYEWDELHEIGDKTRDVTAQILTKIDVLVTGPFILAERDITDANMWRGSRNQRVVDVQATLKTGKLTPLAGIPNNII